MAAILLAVCMLHINRVPAAESVEFFELAQVRLLDGPFKNAQHRDHEYLMAHDVDRFVAPFRTEAGLKPKAPPYPNWESTGLASCPS